MKYMRQPMRTGYFKHARTIGTGPCGRCGKVGPLYRHDNRNPRVCPRCNTHLTMATRRLRHISGLL